jgi:putative transcriptional regulator
MIRILTWLVFVAWLAPLSASADQVPAKGRLLVATEVVHGELFAKTVVLVLHYDATGAFGLVINRPTDVKPEELLADDDAIAGYSGTLFWGGPVQMDSLRAMLLTDEPPEDAEKIIESVYLVSYEDALHELPMEPDRLRFFIGYAGWAPGQLDNEMVHGSWRVLPGSVEHVFAREPGTLWNRLKPAQEQRAATDVKAGLY